MVLLWWQQCVRCLWGSDSGKFSFFYLNTFVHLSTNVYKSYTRVRSLSRTGIKTQLEICVLDSDAAQIG